MRTVAELMERLEKLKERAKRNRTNGQTLESPTSSDKFYCPRCKDELFLIDPNNPWRAIPCPCRNQQLLNKRLKRAMIPEEFEEAAFENFQIKWEHHRKMLDLAKEYLDQFDELFGTRQSSFGFIAKYGELDWIRKEGRKRMGDDKNSYGLGKTHLQMAMAKELIKRGYTVVCISDIDFMDRLSAARVLDDGGVEYQKLLDSAIRPDVLVWDDLGKSKASEFNFRCYYTIINERWREKKPIIFSTNESGKTLVEKIDMAAYSRLLDMSQKFLIQLSGPDYRIKGRGER